MLYFRVGKTQVPILMKCSFCPRESLPFETIYVMQTDAIHEIVEPDGETSKYVPDMEFESMCEPCFFAIKSAVQKFDKQIETDFDFIVQGLQVPDVELRVRTA